VSDIIPTAEAAASAAVALAEIVRAMNEREAYVVPRTRTAIGIVLPLLEAIAAGRVFEVRPERCSYCSGRRGWWNRYSNDAGCYERWEVCHRCDGSGFEPAPPGRKQRTAYDAMIEDAAEGGALDEF
jgi:hypothetical protein